jgi:hypothetical protein
MPSYCSVRTNPPWDDKNCSWLVLFYFSYFSKPTYIDDKGGSLKSLYWKEVNFCFYWLYLKFLSYASGLGTNSLLNWIHLQSNALLTLNKINVERSLLTYIRSGTVVEYPQESQKKNVWWQQNIHLCQEETQFCYLLTSVTKSLQFWTWHLRALKNYGTIFC